MVFCAAVFYANRTSTLFSVLAGAVVPALSALVYIVTTVRARDRVDAARPLVEELRSIGAAMDGANAKERLDAAAKALAAGGTRPEQPAAKLEGCLSPARRASLDLA
jgi:hypothetical protein